MRRKYEYIIRVGVICLCLFCILVCIATLVYTAWDKETQEVNENVSATEPVVEPVVIYEEIPVEAVVNEQDLMLLAKLITCEMGCDWISAEQKYNTGSVVLNRVADPRFPSTIYDVIWQPGQYYCATSGALFLAEPSEEVIEIARDLLLNGSRLPSDVVWQAEFRQGKEVFCTYYDVVLGTTTYYCS